MRIVFDGQALVGPQTGVARYTHGLVEALTAPAYQHDVTVHCFNFRRRPVALPADRHVRLIQRGMPGQLIERAWQKWHWPPFEWLTGPGDVFHFPNFVLPPMRRGRSVLTVHDLSFQRFPETVERQNLAYLTEAVPQSLARAHHVVTVSQAVADEITQVYGLNPAKVTTVPPGVHPMFRQPAEALGSETSGVSAGKPYILAVGTIEPRKNYALLLEAFAKLRQFDGELLIVGGAGWRSESIEAGLREQRWPRVRWLKHVRDEDLPNLYAGAELLVAASLYEGFGFPGVEAMAMGTPVLAADIPVFREVLGDAARYVTGFAPADWTQALEGILGNTAQRRELSERGRRHAQRYTWQACAAAMLTVYNKVTN